MTHSRLYRFFSFLISLSLLLSPIPVTAIMQDSPVITISDLETELGMQYFQYDETIARPFTNIIQVQGLLSVNDELVQNITAVNLSVTDEIVQNSTIGTISATDAILSNVTITTLSITDLIAQNIQATNISVVDETVTGTLSANDEVINSYLNFKASSNYVGLQAPTSVSTSYTLSLPSAVPAASQVIRANATTPTNLEWATDSAFVTPANSQTIYVAVYGNDTTGNGSLATPYATVAKAISIANGLASSSTPITISIGTGIYVEDNSVSPLTVTADGIAIIGQVSSNVILMPNTPANDFMLVNAPVHISDVTFESSNPLATGLTLASGSFTAVINVDFVNFLVGAECVGSPSNSYGFINCFFADNGTGLMVSNAYVSVQDITLFGTSSPSGPSANNAITVTGSGANLVINGGVIALCNTGITLVSNATSTISSLAFRLNTFDINQSGASNLALSACTFQLTTGSSDIEIQVSGAGTIAEIVGCQFDGSSQLGTPEGMGIQVTDNASVNLTSGSMSNYTTALSVGLSTDTASTSLIASSFILTNSTNDIVQQGSASLNVNASTASSSKISINDSTNVYMAFFDLDDNNALTIGSYANQDTTLLQAGINSSTNPEIQYQSSLYSTEGIGFYNPGASASSLFVQSSENANLTAVTTSITDVASLRLVSDTGSPVGGTSALRGWDINKNASTAELSFSFQNSDVSDSEPVVTEFSVMQLDGFNNLVQLPTAGTKIVFDGDTNLYRSAANVLKTDSNFIVGTLTASRAVVTDGSDQLASSATTATEIGYVSGVTSSIQTQINSKVAKAGDTMTGALILPAGSAAAPSLQFTGSTNTGLSAATANVLSFDVSGSEKMNLSSSGLTIDAFSTAGVVHNSSAGLLSSSLIVDADITTATITNDKLANISSSNVPGDIVVRDGSGNFATNEITINGTVTNPTDAATKAYVDAAVSTGLVAHTPCVVVSTTDIGSPPSGPETIDGYTVMTGDRVLLVGQTNEVYNGIWLANTSGAWTYPTDWALGTTAGEAYVLITSGTVNAGSSWLCSTPAATIGTNNITFAEFALPSPTTGANVGGGSGQVYQGKTGITLNFRTLSVADTYLSIVTNSDNVGFSTNATSANTANEIVARDGSGNFSAGTVTANLTGNVTGNVTGSASLNLLLTGGTLTGALTLPAGSAATPSLQFTGSTNTGLSAATANILSFDVSGSEQMNISSSGVTIDGLSTAGVVHNSAAGLLSSSLIVDADITTATITNDKLANISSSNIANDIVVRDGSGNFAAGTITASLTGAASLNVLKAGDTMTGTLQLPAGTTALPSLVFTGSTTAGLSANTGALSFSTNALERLKIASSGTISIDAFTTAGVLHNDASGNLSSSLIVNADVSASAAITDSKLATISTAGKVANSATTATNLNTASAIVARDASGSFAAGLISITDEVISNSVTITPFSTAGVIHNNSSGLLSSSLIVDADITAATITNDKLANISSSNIANDIVVRDGSGNFAANVITATLTGSASLDLPLTGGTLTGTLTLPAGSATAPSLQFTGSTNTGLSAATANVLSFDVNGSEKMNLSSSGLTIDAFSTAGVVHNSSAGLLSSSLIVNADITNATISNAKLAAISSSNIANDIVLRDGTGSFAAQEISMNDGILAGNLILTTDPSTSTAGNIIKGSSSFIHDFGTNNTFVGINAGNFTTSGSGGNSGFGASALTANGTGAFNTGIGYSALAANTTGVDNTALGYNALTASTTDTDNTAIGFNALAANNGASGNTAVGSNALTANTTGVDHTALGYNALAASQTDTDNTAVGYNALATLNGASFNTAVGSNALTANEFGPNNTAVGYNALSSSTADNDNTAVGFTALAVNNGGTYNTAVGSGAMASNSGGSNNTALGYNTLMENINGAGNTAVGFSALLSGVGSDNTAVGKNALTNNTAFQNTAVGSGALAANFTGDQNIAVGYQAMIHSTASGETAIGYQALEFDGGARNTAIGYNVLSVSIADTDNTAVGYNALTTNNGGSFNTAVGSDALFFNTGGSYNTAIGTAALNANTGGIQNTAVGAFALNLNTASYNTGIGALALGDNTTGTFNAAVGYGALAANTIGVDNTALGYNALAANTTGVNNTALGYQALTNNITGTDNIGIGLNSLLSVTTGSTNIAIGSGAGGTLATGSGNIYINANAASASEATTTRIGTSQTNAYMAGIYSVTPSGTVQTVTINSSGQLGSTTSLPTGVSTNTPNTLVLRDGTGSFAAQEVSMNDAICAGNLVLSTNPSTPTAGNIIKGSSRFIHDFGTNNTFVGINAGNFSMTGLGNNTAMGNSVLTANTTGAYNTAMGSSALAANTIGVDNTAIGYNALLASITGTDNTAIGFNALAANAAGTSNNTAVGSSALAVNTTGTLNTAVGKSALAANTIGTHNTALGNNALLVSTTGTDNTALGYNTLPSVTTGSTNIAIGSGAGGTLTTGSGNIYINANAATAAEATTTRIGTSQTKAFVAGIYSVTPSGTLQTVTINSSGQLGSTASLPSGTSLNTPNTLVQRDGTGSFAAQEISMNDGILAGNLVFTATTSTSTTGNVTKGGNPFIHNFGTNNTFVGINAGNLTMGGSGNNTGIGTSALAANSTGNNNTAVGYVALGDNTIGYSNTALGAYAMQNNTSGYQNTAIGHGALYSASPGTGYQNTAVGYYSLFANTTGFNNTAVGYYSLQANTTGTQNVAVGVSALQDNTVGGSNTAVGYSALELNTTGGQNTAMGVSALGINSIGINNTAIGYQALLNNTASNNTAVGSSALVDNTTGAQNVAVGVSALQDNTIGGSNTALGYAALGLNTTGNNNTAVGADALQNNNIGIDNTAVGQNALFANTTGNYNTACGQGTLQANTTGTLNTAVGVLALSANTIGIQNTAVGDNALQDNTTGNNNTAIGQGALVSNLVGSDNTAVGLSALTANTASQNTAVGSSALAANTTGINTAVGYQALTANNIGTNNTAVGWQALVTNTTGNQNTAVGQEALKLNGVGSFNTAVGYQALLKTTNGSNTAVGYQALTNNTGGSQNTAIGVSALSSNTTGANNTALGYDTLLNITTGSNNIAIGNGAGGGNATGSGNVYIGAAVTITAGESNVTRIQNISGINVGAVPAVLVTATGQLGVNTSTRKVKHAIEDMNDESADVLKLRPVTFVYNSDVSETKQYGLIAEEVDEIFPGIVARNKDGEIETVLYNVLPVLLLNEVQKQQKTIEQQQCNIENLTITAESMNAAICSLQEQLQQFIQRMHILENNA